MRAVDTNVLVRLMTRDDARQVAVAEDFVATGAWVPHLAVAEATWVLASVYDREPEAIATAVEMLLSHEHLTIQDSETVAAAVAQFRQHRRWDSPIASWWKSLGRRDTRRSAPSTAIWPGLTGRRGCDGGHA